MKILIISNTYPSKYSPTSYIFTHNQAKALKKNGNEVAVIDIDIRSARWKRKYGIYKEEYDGIDVYRFSVPLITVGVPKIVAFINKRVANFMYNIAKKDYGDFDIVHAHFAMSSGVAGYQIKRKNNIPLVVTEHYSGILKLPKEKLKIAKKIYINADKVISVGSKLKEKIFEISNVNAEVIPNIIDTKIFNLEDNENKDTNKFKFISVGHLIKSKGHHITIEALKRIYKKYKNVELTIIGTGNKKKKLEKMVKEYNLGFIKFIDRVENNILPQYYRKSDCFVLPSYLETFGVVYIEALSCGIPVIATKCGGPEEFVTEEMGILINTDSVNELEVAMESMIEKKGKYDAKKMHDKIDKLYSEKAVVNKLESIYTTILK